MNKLINKFLSLTIERVNGDRPKVVKNSRKRNWSRWTRKRLEKFYFTFGSEQELSVVVFWSCYVSSLVSGWYTRYLIFLVSEVVCKWTKNYLLMLTRKGYFTGIIINNKRHQQQVEELLHKNNESEWLANKIKQRQFQHKIKSKAGDLSRTWPKALFYMATTPGCWAERNSVTWIAPL